jgi:hypothetical protein
MVVHTYNPSTQNAEAGESRVPGQRGLPSKTLPQNKTKGQAWEHMSVITLVRQRQEDLSLSLAPDKRLYLKN